MSSGFLGSGIGPTAIKRRGGLAAPVPVAGGELLTNGGFDVDATWTKEDGWSIDTGTGVAVKIASAGAANLTQTTAATVGAWHRFTFDILSKGGEYGFLARNGGATILPYANSVGVALWTIRFTSNSIGARASAAQYGEIDNASCVPLTLSSLFSTAAYASANCDLSAAITRTAGTQAGLVARLDSATSPANFAIAYLDGAGNVKVDKCVGGTYTNVISGAVTYGSTKILRLVCSGNSVSAYYDGTQVGSTVTVSDAGIVSNTLHGLFSTYASNSFAGYAAA